MRTKLLILSLTLLLTACGSTQPSKFYLLTAKHAQKSKQVVKNQRIVGLGPISLPKYLDQNQMVTRVKPRQLRLAEYNRWAEPLEDNVAQVINDDLTTILPRFAFHQHPWKREVNLKYQVEIEIRQFDTNLQGMSVLRAKWRVRAGNSKKVIFSKVTTYRNKITDPESYDQIAAGMNQNLASLSRDIARQLR